MTPQPVTTAFLKSLSASVSPISLEADETTIGRDPSCHVVLEADAAGVSRRHIVIRRRGQQFAIADLGSSNGTFVNGQRLQAEQPLRSGDCIALGTQGPQYEFVDPAANHQPPPTQVELPPSNAAPPTVVGNVPIAAPANPYGSPGLPNRAIVPPANAYVLPAQPAQTPQSSDGKVLKWVLLGGGLLVGGIGLLFVFRIAAAVLGGGLVATNPPASPQQPTAPESPQAPARPDPGTQPTSSAAPEVESTFLCESANGDPCTSDTTNPTGKVPLAFTVNYTDPLAPPTRFTLRVRYTSPQGEQRDVSSGGSQTSDKAVQSFVVPLPALESSDWMKGTYEFTLRAENAAGSVDSVQRLRIQ